MEPESSLPYSQVPACCVMPPLETLPPGYPSGGVFYLRIVLSPEEASRPWVFLNHIFSRGGVVSASPNPKAGGPPFVGCSRLLIQFIHSCPPYRRPFLHPQSEDAPCLGDRDLPTRLHYGPSRKFVGSLKFGFNWNKTRENFSPKTKPRCVSARIPKVGPILNRFK